MVVSSEILMKFIGQKIKDPYNRDFGYLVHVYTEIDGTVTGIEINQGSTFTTIDPSRVKLDNDSLIILPDWKAAAIRTLTLMEKIRKRQRALDELYSKQEIPKSTYDDMKRKLDSEMLKIKDEYIKIKNSLKNRLNEVEDQLTQIDKAMIAVKMSYISAELSESAYKGSAEILRLAKDSYTLEKDDIRKTLEKLDLLDKEGIDIKTPGQVIGSQDQGTKNDQNKSEIPVPIPVKVINTLWLSQWNRMLKKLFLSYFNSDKKKKEQLGRLLTEISIKLKDQQTRLDESIRRLKERDKDLFDKVVRAQIDGDIARATIYAQEISDIRKMIKIIYPAYLAIEKVRLKLDTVQELQGVSLVLFPIVKILGELKDQIRGISPEVAIALDSITSSVNSIAIETGMINDKGIMPASVDEQAKKIMEEAQKNAEVKMKELLPDLPHPPSEVPSKAEIKRKLNEKEILNYISTTGGFLDIDFISKTYGVEKQEVFTLLKQMANKGLISLEG